MGQTVREGGWGCATLLELPSTQVTQTDPLLSSFRHVEDPGPRSTTKAGAQLQDHPAAPRGSYSPARW